MMRLLVVVVLTLILTSSSLKAEPAPSPTGGTHTPGGGDAGATGGARPTTAPAGSELTKATISAITKVINPPYDESNVEATFKNLPKALAENNGKALAKLSTWIVGAGITEEMRKDHQSKLQQVLKEVNASGDDQSKKTIELISAAVDYRFVPTKEKKEELVKGAKNSGETLMRDMLDQFKVELEGRNKENSEMWGNGPNDSNSNVSKCLESKNGPACTALSNSSALFSVGKFVGMTQKAGGAAAELGKKIVAGFATALGDGNNMKLNAFTKDGLKKFDLGTAGNAKDRIANASTFLEKNPGFSNWTPTKQEPDVEGKSPTATGGPNPTQPPAGGNGNGGSGNSAAFFSEANRLVTSAACTACHGTAMAKSLNIDANGNVNGKSWAAAIEGVKNNPQMAGPIGTIRNLIAQGKLR